VRLQPMRLPQALNGAQANACRFAMARPVQCVARPGGSEQVGTVMNLVFGAITAPMEGEYGDQEAHTG
jgi:hypothetical protein